MLVGKVQQSIVLCHQAVDDGEFVFLCCRRGLSAYLGRRLRVGETVYFNVKCEEVMHDIKLKTMRNGNKLTFDLDCQFDNGDKIDCRLNFQGNSPRFKEISEATEQLAKDQLNGGDMKVKAATDMEVAEAFSSLIDVLRAQNEMVKAKIAEGEGDG
ncbi:hypothetical protein [Porticoccus sp.]